MFLGAGVKMRKNSTLNKYESNRIGCSGSCGFDRFGLLIKKFGLMKVVGSILKVVFFPLFGVIGTFKLIGSGSQV